MDYQETLTELNTTIGDTDNTTFTPEDKERALTKAWNDSYAVIVVRDSTLTFDSSTYIYDIPDTITTIKDISYQYSTSTSRFPETIPSDFWTVTDGQIIFENEAKWAIPQGSTLILKGNVKLDPDADTLDSPNLQEYVIALAGVNTLTSLGFKKVNLFLKNDTSLGELVTLRRELQNDVKELRTRLLKEYESA